MRKEVKESALEAARSIVTLGVTEVEPAKGFAIIIGDSKEILKDVKEQGKIFDCAYGHFKRMCDRRTYALNVSTCCDDEEFRTLFASDFSVVIDGETGSVLCGGFYVKNTDQAHSSCQHGARIKSASAMAVQANKCYVIFASQTICGTVMRPPPTHAMLKVFDQNPNPVDVPVRDADDSRRARQEAARNIVDAVSQNFRNYERLLARFEHLRHPADAYTGALALRDMKRSDRTVSQEELDAYTTTLSNFQSLCLRISDEDSRLREVFTAIVFATETDADTYVGGQLNVLKRHDVVTYFRPMHVDPVPKWLNSCPPKLLAIVGCPERSLADRTNQSQDVASVVPDLLTRSQAEVALLNIQTSVLPCRVGDSHQYVVVWQQLHEPECAQFTAGFLSKFRSTPSDDNRVRLSFLAGLAEIVYSYGVTNHKDHLPNLYHQNKDVTVDWREIELKKVKIIVGVPVGSSDVEVAKSMKPLRSLLRFTVRDAQLGLRFVLKESVLSGEISELCNLAEDLRDLGIQVVIKQGSILLHCTTPNDANAVTVIYEMLASQNFEVISTTLTEVIVDMQSLRHPRSESERIEKVLGVIPRAPVLRALRALLSYNGPLTWGAFADFESTPVVPRSLQPLAIESELKSLILPSANDVLNLEALKRKDAAFLAPEADSTVE